MFSWVKPKEDDTLLWARRLREEREKAKSSDREAYIMDAAARSTLAMYGVEAVEMYLQKIEEMRQQV